ncbi:FAD-binding oxidoreductase [Actinobacteria bacterium YIM 96077]|uniref:FAD-binding oxidoreductase n=1 Tax=Phytoactinopolyspora halophila TaxID=1981511 RepID=A0A329QVM5_9ACTN|nr:FAD-binding and (Fe-S)-binding domain-containing protein [Phytoactinopolyspora halophila]AYY12736.1 FAD-binding oxidoreductase [Actinobacteria bacterium YIM 96077]RAW16470.1 FAD-binding oxidoreductase [Phytoactinopolyspora halophila]
MSEPASDHDARHLVDELRSALSGEVEDGITARATYSMDASNYRHVPVAVVFPRTPDDVASTVRLCREHRTPITTRGAATSIGGQALGRGVVVDCTRYLNAIVEIDPEARTARVQPGVVLDDLRAAAAEYGLTFGPDPSTHSRCTIGGMIGNDACGSHSVAWGRTSDNVVSLDVLTADGVRMSVGSTGPDERRHAELPGRAGEIHRQLQQLATENLALLRQGFPALPRRVSGYAVDQLLPENGGNVARALVGTEGTCVLVTEATVRLVPAPSARVLVVAGYADDVAAADAAPAVLPLEPLTIEGMGADLVDALLTLGRRPAALDHLPAGGGWLFVEVGGPSAAEAERRGRDVAAELEMSTGAATVIAADPDDQRALWSIREAAAGIVTRMADGSEAWPGWEDAAVPPQQLGSYLRELRELLRSHGLHGRPYGHFGEGCVHIRIDFGLTTAEGRRQFRAFLNEAADLVVAHGGSLSGEHGDGQARSELLPRMYSAAMINLFEQFKAIWDPDDLLNPGVLVRPRPLDSDLRFDGPTRELPVTLRYPGDDGSFAAATRRCVGVGACLDGSGVMCPSYMVTGAEEHSTRGRARMLFEMMRGETITDGWRSTEVRDALDLCLACKGCLSDCPVNVDMASYKAEFLHHHYARRLRPASHYSLGFLPVAARVASVAPGVVNAVIRRSGPASLVKRLGGIAPERSLPRFARRSLRGSLRSGRRRSHRLRSHKGHRPSVLLWPDTFTNFFAPEIGVDAVRVLEHAGFDVRLPRSSVCCGLTWISTGQLGIARRVLRRTVRALEPELRAGIPIVGLEPSCLAALRYDAREILGDAELNGLPERVHTLAGVLDRYAPDVEFPGLEARSISQQHCHQHAVFGYEAEERLLARAGVQNETPDSGCCGLAGNFGMEKGHYGVSVALANRVLVPAIEAAAPDTLIVADGFSCRTQISELTGQEPVHLAQVLARTLPT